MATMILTTATTHQLSKGVNHLAASLHGYHLVFMTMIVIEIIGLVLALLLRDTKKQAQD